MAGKTGQEVQEEIRKAAQSKNPDLSVAFVGEETDFVDVFHVLKQLKLAENFHDEASKDAGAAKKDKDKELKTANPNVVKDKKTGQKYLVDPLPSVIISVTGDAQDMPEDHEFIASVDDLMKFMEENGGVLKLNREAASRAISMMTANKKEKIQEKIDELVVKMGTAVEVQARRAKATAAKSSTSMCMQISLLIQERIRELQSNQDPKYTKFQDSKKHDHTFSDAFRDYPSARDVMLNVVEGIDKQFDSLKTYCFTADDRKERDDPVVTGKRLSKARLEKFLQSGLMGAALKVSDSTRSAWIVDGGSNGGVMKLAGTARKNMGSIGLNIPLIGIGVAIGSVKDQNGAEISLAQSYETEGHSHLILAVDPNGNCPTKNDGSVLYGYEIEYTKLFEDSVSMNFRVPIVGLLVGGGPGSLQNVVEAIEGNFPVVVIKGTGRVADLICGIRERQSTRFVKNQCQGVEYERVKKCSAYSKLHILDLSLEGPEAFVQFVQSHIRNYSTSSSSKKQYRSSHFTDLFSFLSPKPQPEAAPSLTLELGTEKLFARWSLTFGTGQVDSKEKFVRNLTFKGANKRSSMKCAEAAVHVMRLMFPLPVAIVSTISMLKEPAAGAADAAAAALAEEKALVTATIGSFLAKVKPFYVWSMQQGEAADTFEIRVHVVGKFPDRMIKCVFKELGGIPVREMEVAISNILHSEYGVVPVAFSKLLRNHPENQLQSNQSPDNQTQSDGPYAHFINRISNSCLQSTKVLMITEPLKPSVPQTTSEPMKPVSQRAELFLLEQSLDCTSLYNQLVADFFIDMKEELQQRIHGEDADELCRSACERIKRSPAASLPLHFHKMEPKVQERLVRYLPEQFLRRSFVSGEEDPKAVGAFEHDFDFPVFTSVEHADTGSAKENWIKYWEYLFLNCGDSRPYAPCWDPIALQDKARKVFHTIGKRVMNMEDGEKVFHAIGKRVKNMKVGDHKTLFHLDSPEYTPPHLLTHLYRHFRSVIVADLLLHWETIREEKGYSNREVEALMQRFERAIKKVFYFLMCCKRILFCDNCIDKCGLKADENSQLDKVDTAYQQQYKIYALKCSMCDNVPGKKETLKRPVYKEMTEKKDDSSMCLTCCPCPRWPWKKDEEKEKKKHIEGNLDEEKEKKKHMEGNLDEEKEKKKHIEGNLQKKGRRDLKGFCFQWFMKVGLDLKKACSTSLLRHHGDLRFSSSLKIDIGSTETIDKSINLSHSREKVGIPMLENVQERSRLRKIFLEVVEICRSGMVIVQQEVDPTAETLACSMLGIVVMAEQVNRVVAECDSLKTGCSTYEAFPKLDSRDIPERSIDPNVEPMTHLMVAAVEGNVRKASAYIAGADISYIFFQYRDQHRIDSRGCSHASSALHMALERGNTDVANAIIERTWQLVQESAFDSEKESLVFLDELFLGACSWKMEQGSLRCEVLECEVPTSFMYLARYAMIEAMDKVSEILHHLRKPEQMQQEGLWFKYMIRPADSNGMNALHYAVLSQSPQCVAWFVPYMHDFHICYSGSKLAYVPPMSTSKVPGYDMAKFTTRMGEPKSFQFGYTNFTRMHPPSNYSDSDCRLVISEDWIQAYHYSSGLTAFVEGKHASRGHKEMSPYELALMLWRLTDIESMHAQEIVHNIYTNTTKVPSGNDTQEAAATQAKTGYFLACLNRVFPAQDDSKSTGANGTSDSNKQRDSQVNHAKNVAPDDSQPERLAEAYKQRSNSYFKILTGLEEAADAEVEIDAKKKKGLRQFLEYRNRRAISRLVFPVIAYLGYVVASTLMAFLMTNGLMDEPTKLTQGVINELQWGPQNGPQKDIRDIGSYSDLTVFWGVLAGFLWSASPMDRPFATYKTLGPVLVRQTRTPRISCINGQAMCTPSNYRSTTFSPDQTALFVDYADETEDFSFYDNSGSTYTVPYTPRIVKPQWGNEYYYSGGGYALSFACSNNQTMASSCQAQQKSGYVTCNCSLRFQDLLQPPTAAADGSSSTFLDASTRALDVSFLVFSPSLESYVFFHMLFEFSETGTVRVWDDYVTFSGRYSKQFSNEKLSALRVSQYVTIVYALMYLFYEYEDWKVLSARIPDSLNPDKSKQLQADWDKFQQGKTNVMVLLRQIIGFRFRRLSCHLQLFFNKSEYYGPIYQLLELIGLACGYSVIGLDLSLQSQLKQLFALAGKGSFNDPGSIPPKDGMGMHRSVSDAHTLLAIEREVIGAYMFFTWARVFAYLVHMPGWGPYLHAIIATIFEPIVIAFVMVVVMLNAAFTIMMYCSYSITGGSDFKTLQDSFFSMWRMLMGLNDNFSFVENNRGIGNPKFSKGTSGVAYIFLTVLGNLVVMNIIVGLLSERYAAIGKFSLINFNRELNTNLAKDIIAVKSSEGLNPFSLKIPFFKCRIGLNFLNRWKLDVRSEFALKMMLFMEGYYLDAAMSFFKMGRLNSPAVLFRLKWFHGDNAPQRPSVLLFVHLPHISPGGVAQEREVCKKLIKFVNVSTTPLGVIAASNRGHKEKKGHKEKHEEKS